MDVIYYKNCSDLPIYNFNKVLEEDNHCYLVIGWDENKEISIDNEYCAKLWDEIYNEYCKLTNDTSMSLFYKAKNDLLKLQIRYTVVSEILKVMDEQEVFGDIKKLELYANLLSKWNYIFDTQKPYFEEMAKMYKQLKLSVNKIELKEAEIKNMNEQMGDRISFTRQVVKLEIALNKNNIDTKTTSVEKWVEMINEVKEINEARKYKNAS